MQFIGHVGLALGTSISIWFGTFYLSYLLIKEGYLILDSFNCFLPIFIFCMLMGSLLALLESWLNKTQLLDIHVLGILVIFGIDRLTKMYLINLQSGGTDIDFYVFPFLNFYLVWNTGVGFGLFCWQNTKPR